MTESRDYLEMAFHSIQCFTDDGRLDANELGRLVEIAEKDGAIDHNEIRVLQNIISRIQPHEIDSAMQVRLNEISERIGVKAEPGAHA